VSRTWLAARPRGGGGRIATAGRTRERRDPRRSPGRRKGFEAERRRSAGAPIPCTSSEARSEVTETTRDRKARGQRRSNACGGGSPVEAARTRTLVGAVRPDACRGRPGRRAREVRTATNTTSLEGNMSLLASLRRGRLQVTRYITRGPRWCGDSSPHGSTGGRFEASRAGGDGESPVPCFTFALPNRRHAFTSGVPPKTPGEKSGSRFPRG